MIPPFAFKRHTLARQFSTLALVGLACGLWPLAAEAAARGGRNGEELQPARPAGVPVIAIVALGEQRVTIYDADGKILRAPVSTGQTGYETPAGIFSVIQKEAEHYSNLYDDASMPFMQRITWSGIALHAGVLPGHPASHGCIRMPYAFAEHLFELTKIGLRVIIVPSDVAPAPFAHPALFKPKPIEEAGPAQPPPASEGAQPMGLGASVPSALPPKRPRTLKSIADAKAEEVNIAAVKAEAARQAAVQAGREAARFIRAARMAEGVRMRAQAQWKEVERALESAASPEEKGRAEEAKAKILGRIQEAEGQLASAKAEGQPAIDAAAAAREAVKGAEAARVASVAAAKEAAARLSPVSVFISRPTQRLWVRQAFQPVLESPIVIRDPERPIGTHVFTALAYLREGAELRWSAVGMSASTSAAEPGARQRRHRGGRSAEPVTTDAIAAKSALDRIAIPQEAADRIAEVVSPGSSLIISDEALSKETSKGTDFVVLMSGEPQGGIKIRRRSPYAYQRNDGFLRAYRRAPYRGNPYSWW